MTNIISSLLIGACFVMYSQPSGTTLKHDLQEKILQSVEAKEWQLTMIAFQKSKFELCALINAQKQLVLSHNNQKSYSNDKNTLQLFRTMRITDSLKGSAAIKEKTLRKKYPEIAFHFTGEEIFTILYTPILKAREEMELNFK